MKEWKYLIGNESYFQGSPDDSTYCLISDISSVTAWSNGFDKGSVVAFLSGATCALDPSSWGIIAQRTESFGNAIDLEFCKANPDHPDCKCKEIKVTITDQQAESMQRAIDEFSRISGIPLSYLEGREPSKYNRPCKGITLDVYDVLQAFAVTNPATQHAIKKLLCAGLRGNKDKMQDLTEALKSIERAIELEKS